MKYIFILLALTGLVMADGIVLFEKSNGVLYSSDNETKRFDKLQPAETKVFGTTIGGRQVLKRVDWQTYDLAKYDTASDNPITTNDLTGVVRQYVHETQTAKANGKRQYENAYFTLVKSVLTLANDPRKDTVPIPKLSFDELDSILDVLYETPATEKRANKLALKLLSVNAALQRYDINWWDGASYHSDL